MAAMAGYFSPDLFRFLRELRAHNDREWFTANKARYEREGRDPLLRFIVDLGPELARFAKHFVADPRPVGGSMMRIYRDTRFAKDKSPYKTALMAHFQHARGEEGATPGFYLRLEPGHSAVGAGIWRPEPGALKKIRKRIADDSKGWQRVTSGKTMGLSCGMAGESLKRPPPGFDPEHPCIEDIKRKDFAITVELDDKRIASPAFKGDVVKAYKAITPFVEFVTRAIGLPF